MSKQCDTNAKAATTSRRRFIGLAGAVAAGASGVRAAGELGGAESVLPVGTAAAASCTTNLPRSDKSAGPVRVSTQKFYGGGEGVRLTVVNDGRWQPRVRVRVECFARCGRSSAGLMRWRLVGTDQTVRSMGGGRHDVLLDTAAGTDAVRVFVSRNWI